MKGPLRKSLFTVALSAAVIAAAIGTVPAIAAPPQAVTFAVAGEFASPPGVFTSGGGIVCSSGSATDEAFFFTEVRAMWPSRTRAASYSTR